MTQTDRTSMKRRHFLALAAGSMAVPHLASAGAPLSVVATTGMIADTVRQIGAEHVTVRALMGPGVDPHAYRQTRSDIVAMTRTDLVLWHGLYLEAQMEDFLTGLARKKRSVAVASDLPQEMLISHSDYDGRYDPHVWMVPDLWRGVARKIADVLTDAHPSAADAFAANLTQFETQLDTLQGYAQTSMASIPANARVLLTAHDAFGYLGRAFDMDVIGIQGISTESEAGLNRIASLVDLLVSRRIGAVFVESSVSDRNIRALIEGAAAQGHSVSVGGELFSDAMGEEGTYEATYIGMIDHNITTIAGALGGTVPARGMNGTLSAGS